MPFLPPNQQRQSTEGILIPGRSHSRDESQFPGLDRFQTLDFARVRIFTCMIGVGSSAGARRGGDDHRPDPAPFPADDGTPSPLRTINIAGGGAPKTAGERYGGARPGSATAIGPRTMGQGITTPRPSDVAGQSVDVVGGTGV